MALAQLFGDVVDAAGLGGFGFVLRLKTAHQTGHGLVDALDREGRAALGRLKTLGDHLQRSAHAAQVLMAAQAFMPVRILAIDVVQAARAAAAVIGVWPSVVPDRRAGPLAVSRALGSMPFTLHGAAAVPDSPPDPWRERYPSR